MISSYLFLRHLRSDPSVHILHYKKGEVVRSGRGLAFWFFPLSASVAALPVADREQSFLFKGRSQDFQEVTAQGLVTYRVADPEKLASRLDFSVSLDDGRYLKTPLEQLAGILTQLSQQLTGEYLAVTPVRHLLAHGVEELSAQLGEKLPQHPNLWALGLEVVSASVSDVSPTPELEQALQAPTREGIQQESDEAVFQRRALAVEKERAIQENELANRIELAKREENLIAQEGQNELRRAREEAEAKGVAAEAAAARKRLHAESEAKALELLEAAKNGAERDRIDVYRDLPARVQLGLAAQELASKLQRIDHLNLSPELLGPLLTNVLTLAEGKLEQ
ncbi:MAG TPA: band 7 protein [Planctomycetes bacterium]|nr:band 7 protein [Planctomycetota bacterium]